MWRTMILTVTTCFLAGTSYTHWIVDHDTLWRSPTPPHAISTSLAYYGILSGGSPRLAWFWVATCLIAIASIGGRCAVGLRELRREGGVNTGGYLFDAACTLLLIRVLVSQTQSFGPAIASIGEHVASEEELVRELADTNLVISVALTGVVLLQAGRYYSERVSSKSARRLLAPTSRETTPGGDDTPASSTRSLPPSERVDRPGTPYRELTQDEAMELESDLDLNDGENAEDEVVTSVRTRRV